MSVNQPYTQLHYSYKLNNLEVWEYHFLKVVQWVIYSIYVMEINHYSHL